MRFIVIPFLLFLMMACDPIDDRLTIRNNSNEIIFYISTSHRELGGNSPTINSFKVNEKDTLWDETSNLIFPLSSKKLIMIGRNGWEDFINEECEDGKLKIYILENNLFKTYPWDTIVNKQLYSKKYEMSIKDLSAKDWTIFYDGS